MLLKLLAIAVVAILVAGAPPSARADPKILGHSIIFGGGLDWRFLMLDASADRWERNLDAYGYSRIGFGSGQYATLGVAFGSLVEAGVLASHETDHLAHPNGHDVELRLAGWELGLYLRPRIPLGGAIWLAAPLLVGAEVAQLALRRETVGAVVPIARAGLALDISFFEVVVSYQQGFPGDSFEPYLAPPVGGLLVQLGFRIR